MTPKQENFAQFEEIFELGNLTIELEEFQFEEIFELGNLTIELESIRGANTDPKNRGSLKFRRPKSCRFIRVF